MIKSQLGLFFRYLNYLIKAKHSAGHGIHSPFIFDFVLNVLFINDKNQNYTLVNDYRKLLHLSKQNIEIIDKGAGSIKGVVSKSRINDISRMSSIKSKYGKLLARIVAYYKPLSLIELGTSFGISSSYLSINLQKKSELYTIEGDPAIFEIAKSNLIKNFEPNIIPLNGSFDEILPELLQKINQLDLVFFDGNHRKEPTIKYFELCLKKISNQSIFIFDDIHWSNEMEEAWEYIKSHQQTRVCIDLFQFGIVFFRKELSCENYIIRF